MAEGKILIVDDDPDAIEFVKAVLEEAGYEVAAAGDGEAGLAAARDGKPDLILLDVQMPGKDGFEVFTDVRQDPELRAIPVVMLTGVAEKTGLSFSAEDMGEFLGEEPNAYVEKPVDPETLTQVVREVLAG